MTPSELAIALGLVGILLVAVLVLGLFVGYDGGYKKGFAAGKEKQRYADAQSEVKQLFDLAEKFIR